MKITITTFILLLISLNIACSQQMSSQNHIIAVDTAHDPAFWGDPSNTEEFDQNRANRIQYLASQLRNNASAVSAELIFLNDEITSKDLTNTDLLYIHVPTSHYNTREVEAITDFLEQGGSLFLAMDADYWTTLEQANVNDMIRPYGIQLGPDSPDTQVGALTKSGEITAEAVKIPYHGGRIVNGGIPFAFTVGSEEIPFGIFKKLDGGGKIIVMGDAMASLYMNSWQDVDDYQTEKFMGAVVEWLLD